VDLLLDSFALLAPRVPSAVLLLVGGGAALPELKCQAQRLGIGDRCRVAGRVGADDAAALQRLAQVSVDPVRDDLAARARWPIKIMESLAAAVPVVTGDVGDRREMLGDGTAGRLVTPGNAPELADALEAVLTDSTLHQQLAQGCRARAASYDPGRLAEDLFGFYQRLGPSVRRARG
jgi:glycosyltransferase involved in cell wall biosynthesis